MSIALSSRVRFNRPVACFAFLTLVLGFAGVSLATNILMPPMAPFKAYSPGGEFLLLVHNWSGRDRDKMVVEHAELLHDVARMENGTIRSGLYRRDESGVYRFDRRITPSRWGLEKVVFSPSSTWMLVFYDFSETHHELVASKTRIWICDLQHKTEVHRTVWDFRSSEKQGLELMRFHETLKWHYYIVADGLRIDDRGVLTFRTNLGENVSVSSASGEVIGPKRLSDDELVIAVERKKWLRTPMIR